MPPSPPERQPSERQASQLAQSGSRAMWAYLGAAIIAGVIGFYVVLPALTPVPDSEISRIIEISPAERAAALKTLSDSADMRHRAEQATPCDLHLAELTATATGHQEAKIRIKSGTYFSPVLTIGANPVRMAVPFPAPYQTGTGTLQVEVEGGEVTLALDPPWHILPGPNSQHHTINWQPSTSCATK